MSHFCWSFCLLLLWLTHHTHGATFARAETEIADDTDVGMYYSGLWVPDGDPNTYNHHDTWTNQSGASVTFNFIGTQVEVFATRRPAGTYHTSVSFAIDGGAPTVWTTDANVPEIEYQNLVYTSPTLAPTQHEITITNLGVIFWFDYLQWTTGDAVTTGATTTTSSSTPNPPSSSSSSSSSSSRDASPPPSATTSRSTATPTSPSSTTSSVASSGTTAVPVTDSSSTTSATSTDPESQNISSASADASGWSWPTTSSSAGAAAASDGSGSGSSHTSNTPIIVGVVIGVLGALALLLAALWWWRVQARARATQASDPGEMVYATSSGSPRFVKDRSPPQWTPTSPASWGAAAARVVAGDPSSPSRLTPSANPAAAQGWSGSSHQGAQEDGEPPVHRGEKGVYTPPPLTDATSAVSSPSVPATVRYSRDVGIRIAGGPAGEEGEQWAPARYDADAMARDAGEVETLPPAYAQILRSADGG